MKYQDKQNKQNRPNSERHQGEPHDQEKDNPDREKKIDEQLEQSFPASDPPSYSQPGNELDEDE